MRKEKYLVSSHYCLSGLPGSSEEESLPTTVSSLYSIMKSCSVLGSSNKSIKVKIGFKLIKVKLAEDQMQWEDVVTKERYSYTIGYDQWINMETHENFEHLESALSFIHSLDQENVYASNNIYQDISTAILERLHEKFTASHFELKVSEGPDLFKSVHVVETPISKT